MTPPFFLSSQSKSVTTQPPSLTLNYSCLKKRICPALSLGPSASLRPWSPMLGILPQFCEEAAPLSQPSSTYKEPSNYPPKAAFSPHHKAALCLSQSQLFRATLKILYNSTVSSQAFQLFLPTPQVCEVCVPFQSDWSPRNSVHPTLALSPGSLLMFFPTLSSLVSPTSSCPAWPQLLHQPPMAC